MYVVVHVHVHNNNYYCCLQLYTENEALKQKIEELERRLDSKDYFAMMYKIACDDTAKES